MIKNIICVILSIIGSIITHILIAPFLVEEEALVLLLVYFCTYMGMFVSITNIVLKCNVKYFIYAFFYCLDLLVTILSFMLALSENTTQQIKTTSFWVFAVSFIIFCIFTGVGIKMEQKEKYKNID